MSDTASSTNSTPRLASTTGTRFLTAAAAISTVASYVGIVGFARDIVGMGDLEAAALAGFFEIGLVGAGFMAREAAGNGDDARTLTAVTWVLSLATGAFAAAHELVTGAGPYSAAFRLAVPLAAAFFWHLVLVGTKAQAAGRTMREIREDVRFHQMITAQRAHHRQVTGLKVTRAIRRQDRAEARAVRMIGPDAMKDMSARWGIATTAVISTRVLSANTSDPDANVPADVRPDVRPHVRVEMTDMRRSEADVPPPVSLPATTDMTAGTDTDIPSGVRLIRTDTRTRNVRSQTRAVSTFKDEDKA
ncbi:MAG: hypothetical protein ACRDTJ_20270, partial [Pseudonocardiaceae bacterium]